MNRANAIWVSKNTETLSDIPLDVDEFKRDELDVLADESLFQQLVDRSMMESVGYDRSEQVNVWTFRHSFTDYLEDKYN